MIKEITKIQVDDYPSFHYAKIALKTRETNEKYEIEIHFQESAKKGVCALKDFEGIDANLLIQKLNTERPISLLTYKILSENRADGYSLFYVPEEQDPIVSTSQDIVTTTSSESFNIATGQVSVGDREVGYSRDEEVDSAVDKEQVINSMFADILQIVHDNIELLGNSDALEDFITPFGPEA